MATNAKRCEQLRAVVNRVRVPDYGEPVQLELFAVIGIAVIVTVAAFSRRLGLAAPIILVLVGVGFSYIPGVPAIEIPHDVILDGLLPPILFAAAIRVPVVDFRRNFESIASLSFLLVLFTTAGAGLLLHLLLPGLNLALAFALGAVISPPDAVAATSVGRRLGLPPRLLTVLEGEGLMNDATALVLLRSATAAAAGGFLTPWSAGRDFLFAVVVAVVIGLAAGYATVIVRSKFTDPVLDTALSIAVPFIAFIPTEAAHESGVLAVVVAGLYSGHASPSRFTAQARISDRINWRTIQFLLENAVFLIIGLEIRTLIEQVHSSGKTGVAETIGIGLLITIGLIALRFAWLSPLVLALKFRERHKERDTFRRWLSLEHDLRLPKRGLIANRRRQTATLRYERQRADLDQLRAERIDWKGSIVLSWSGMRGVVTLAAAQSLPDFPYRPQLVLIAFVVAVTTLIGQGATLPILIRVLRIQGVDRYDDRRELATLLDEISYGALEVIRNPDDATDSVDGVDPDVLERARQASFLRAESAWERSEKNVSSSDETPHRVYRQVRLAIVEAERERLLDARSRGAFSSRVLAEAQRMLDLEETRLTPRR